MIFGLDALGLPKYSDVIAETIPAGWALGCFANTFGDAIPHVDKVLRTLKVPVVRVHLLWSDTHSFTSKDLPVAIKEAKRWFSIITRYPGVEWRISPTCEHKMGVELAQKFILECKKVLPLGTIMVNTPMAGGAVLKLNGVINEVHGSKAKPLKIPFQFSYDGNSADDSDVESIKARMKDSEIFFFWNSRFNGRWEDNDPTPKPKRKGWPDNDNVKAQIVLSKSKGPTKLPKNSLVKSAAENKGNNDPRAEHPLIIIPNKSSKIELKTKDGKTLDTLNYYGTYSGGGHRYYSKVYGYKTFEKAMMLTGTPVLDMWVDGKIIGQCNVAFRDPTYR